MSPIATAGARPFVVAIEGLDGTGKTTQTDLLATALRAHDNTAVDVRSFPVYTSFFGTRIGRVLHGAANELDPRSTALWFALDRFDDFRTNPPFGDVLILNRFTLSNAVYQSARAEPDQADDVYAFVLELEHGRLGLPNPDLTIFLDLPEAESIRRVAARAENANSTPDSYELNTQLQQRVRQRYRNIVALLSGGCVVACADETGLRSPEAVHGDVLRAVLPQLASHRRLLREDS